MFLIRFVLKVLTKDTRSRLKSNLQNRFFVVYKVLISWNSLTTRCKQWKVIRYRNEDKGLTHFDSYWSTLLFSSSVLSSRYCFYFFSWVHWCVNKVQGDGCFVIVYLYNICSTWKFVINARRRTYKYKNTFSHPAAGVTLQRALVYWTWVGKC